MIARVASPTVSVITINRNTGNSVGRTIHSVLAQTYPFQWVVVDGASSDDSLGALRSAIRPGDMFISEPDTGIAEAFNKGLGLATAEAVVFMNAGDEFADPNALRQLIVNWNYEAFDWAFGAAEVVDESGTSLFVRRIKKAIKPQGLVQSGCRVFHQASIVKRQLFEEFGGFDQAYKLAMDYEFLVRLIKAGKVPQILDHVVCRFRLGGMSSDPILRWNEDSRARKQNGMANSWLRDLCLRFIVSVKSRMRSRVGPWAFRLKEVLRW